MLAQAGLKCLDDSRVIRQAEIIAASKVDELAIVEDHASPIRQSQRRSQRQRLPNLQARGVW